MDIKTYQVNKTYTDKEVKKVNDRITTITTEQQQDGEVIEARGGEVSLKANIDRIDAQLAKTAALEGWELQNKIRKPQPLMTFVSDDGYNTDYTKLKPISESENVPFVMAIIPTRIGSPSHLTKAQLDELYGMGWEISSHSNTHLHLTELTDEELDNELKLSRDSLRDMGYNCTTICYPFGFYDSRVKEATRKYYRAARSSDTGINKSPIETYQLDRQLFAENSEIDPSSGLVRNSLEFYKLKVDEAIAQNGWLIWLMHSANTAVDSTQLNYLQQLIQYAKSKGVDVVTMQEALDRMGNIVDIGDYDEYDLTKEHYVVGADGKESRTAINNTIYSSPTDAYNNSSPASVFPNGKITHTKVTLSNAEGLPNLTGGKLITDKIQSENGRITQELISYNNKDKYTRYCRTDGTWSQWEYAGPSYINLLSSNTKLASNAPSDFEVGKITYCKITNANAEGLPNNIGGILITDKMGSGDGYATQTFYEYNTNNMYIRSDTKSGNWSSWQIVKNYIVVQPDNSVSNSSDRSSFEAGKISYCRITSAYSSGFPSDSPGTLMTNRIVDSARWDYQEYRIYETGDVYQRQSNNSGSWNAWKQISMTDVI
jgi:peptidoglycan/xylan/chitin deacetylase (PgdA/CDA1 family)